MKEQIANRARSESSSGPSASPLLQRKCDCGQHTIGGSTCANCSKQNNSFHRLAAHESRDASAMAPPRTAHATARPSPQPFDATARAFKGPRFGHDFSHIRAHADVRASESAWALNAPAHTEGLNVILGGRRRAAGETPGRNDSNDQRPGRGIEDPIHQPLLDTFRQQQGQPPGGVDEEGHQVGPSDAEIKYRIQPIAVLNGPFHAPIDDPTEVGMEIQITVQSSSGNNADMANVMDSEKVSLSFDHTGTLAGVPPIPSTQSGFMSAVGIPNDRHGLPRAQVTAHATRHPGNGTFSKHQLDVYTDVRRGVVNPIAIPNSGYRITRTLTTGPGTQIMFRVDKTPEACTVDGFSTTAGPSPAQHDEVIVRP